MHPVKFVSKRDRQQHKPAIARTTKNANAGFFSASAIEVEKPSNPLRDQYMGLNPPKKKSRKLGDNKKFVFDWTDDQDTFVADDPLYSSVVGAAAKKPETSTKAAYSRLM